MIVHCIWCEARINRNAALAVHTPSTCVVQCSRSIYIEPSYIAGVKTQMKRTRWRCPIRVFTAAITAGLLVSQAYI